MIERLGKYEISGVLGKGAMGVVYKGFDPGIRRTVAIKTIRKELIEDGEGGSVVARFRNEAQAAGRLSHPGIVAVYDYGEDAALAYIAMEFVPGSSLREYFAGKTQFTQQDIVSLVTQLLDALDCAHGQGVWHRDVKPANLMITTAGKLKVADFGIARIDSSNLTMTGAIMGTPGYMAPEQYQGTTIDWRADLFATGVVLYQLLAGEKPFAGTPEQTGFKTCYENPRLPSSVKPDAGVDRYDAIIIKALAKDPAQRFESAAAFRAALLEAYAAPVSPVISEDTIITATVKAAYDGDGSGPVKAASTSQPPASSGTPKSRSGTTIAPPGWDPAVLKQIEGFLVTFAGPMARVLIKRAAMKTTDVDALYAALAADLPSDAEQRGFRATRKEVVMPATNPGVTRSPTPPSGTSVTRGTASVIVTSLPADVVDQASRQLASYLGPIASVFVKKAAAKANSRTELYRLLAEQLPTDAQRQRFLADAGL